MFTILTLYGSWLRSRDNKPDRSSSSEDPGAVLEQSCSAGIDRSAILALAFAGLAVSAQAQAQTPPESSAKIPPAITTPSTVETRIGTLEFKDGAPTIATAEKLRDTLDFTAALNVYNNSFRGASAYALGKGFQSIGAEDDTPIIFSELMDAKSLFLTANADTVYYWAMVNLSKGPMVIDQPPLSLGAINDMWFSWIIDIGFPGPDRGEGGKYLILPPGYDGPLPEGGFYIARSKTNRVLYAARAFLTNNDPKPTVEMIKQGFKIYSYTPGGVGTSIATALEGKVRLSKAPPVPPAKFVEGTGKAFNTIPPGDFGFFEMINANVQEEPATSYDPELAGQLAAIGIVKGKPFNPDARMKKILADAAAIGNAAGRVLNWRTASVRPDWAYYPKSAWMNMLFEGGAYFESRARPRPRRDRPRTPPRIGGACGDRPADRWGFHLPSLLLLVCSPPCRASNLFLPFRASGLVRQVRPLLLSLLRNNLSHGFAGTMRPWKCLPFPRAFGGLGWRPHNARGSWRPCAA